MKPSQAGQQVPKKQREGQHRMPGSCVPIAWCNLYFCTLLNANTKPSSYTYISLSACPGTRFLQTLQGRHLEVCGS